MKTKFKITPIVFGLMALLWACLLGLGLQSTKATEFVHWSGREPEGTPKTLAVLVGVPPQDVAYPRPTVEELGSWCQANGWTPETPGHIIVRNMNWRSQPSYYMLRQPDDDTGIVTPEIAAEFLLDDMQGILRLAPWWKNYLDILDGLGYTVSVVAMDWEAKFTSNWTYDLNAAGTNVFDMHDVVDVMLPWPGMMAKLPRLDMPSWNAGNIYGVRKNEQTMLLFNYWVMKKQSARLTEVFADQTAEVFPDAIVSNYNCVKTSNSPLISWVTGHPQGLPAVGNSAFLAYLHPTTGYKTNEDVKAAFGVIDDPTKATVWVGNPNRWEQPDPNKPGKLIYAGWKQSQEQFDDLNNWLIAQGVAVIVVF